MQIEAREILFIRQNKPSWLFKQVADNTGKTLARVRYNFYGMLEEHDEDVIQEARRLLKEACNIVYIPNTVTVA